MIHQLPNAFDGDVRWWKGNEDFGIESVMALAREDGREAVAGFGARRSRPFTIRTGNGIRLCPAHQNMHFEAE